jgi:hypothetical protein
LLFTFTWIVRVKSINCSGFSKKKKKIFTLVNSATIESCSTDHWKITTRSSKMLLLQTCGTAAKIDGSYQEKSFFFLLPNIDICGCGAGEPHPQPHYQLPISVLMIVRFKFNILKGTNPWAARPIPWFSTRILLLILKNILQLRDQQLRNW